MSRGPFQRILHLARRLTPQGNGGDGDLLSRFVQTKDEDAFAALVRRHGPLVLGVCRRVLRDRHRAEDAFQATFVVLARKASSVARPALLGNWLYGVAYHTAVRARDQAHRLRRNETPLEEDVAAASDDSTEWQELRAILDEELHRLPEKFRAPLVLCYLQGKTNEEAAQDLGCPTGSLWWRLSRGAALLRERLTSRGLALSAGFGAALTGRANAAVSASLVEAAVRPAALLAAGASLETAGVTAPAAELAKGVLRTMFLTKLTIKLVLTCTLVLLGAGVTALAWRTPPKEEAPAKAPLPEGGKPVEGLKLTLSAEKDKTVLLPDGSNAESVQIQLSATNVGEQELKLDTYFSRVAEFRFEVTGPDGQSVRVVPKPFVPPPLQPGPVRPESRRGRLKSDYPILKPGQSHAEILSHPDILGRQNRFPGYLGTTLYCLTKPGEYRFRVVYESRDRKGQDLPDFAAGSWVGSVSSNELTLTVQPAEGKEVKGLKLTLSASRMETVLRPDAKNAKVDAKNAEAVKLRLTFANVSDKDLLLNTYVFTTGQWFNLASFLQVTGPDGKEVGRAAVPPAPPRAPRPEDFRTIRPGQNWEYELDFPTAAYLLDKVGDYRVSVTYRGSEDTPPHKTVAFAAGSWSGTITSNEKVLKVAPEPKLKVAPEKGDPPRELRFQAQTAAFRFGKLLAIRNQEELLAHYGVAGKVTPDEVAKIMANAATTFGVKEIDFTKQMIVVVSVPDTPAPGCSVKIDRIEVIEKNKARVTWRIVFPPKAVDKVGGAAGVAVLVETFNGTIEFHQQAGR